MNFLNRLLKRPENESPYLILVVGYAAEGATVPRITRKSFHEICTIV
jgi:iodotyrosine deiodinase